MTNNQNKPGRTTRTFALGTVALTATLALGIGFAPTAAADGNPTCSGAAPGTHCELHVNLSTAPLGWMLLNDPAWNCGPALSPEGQQRQATCIPGPTLPVQIICVSVTVTARVAGSGSISVTGNCNPRPAASCTATTGFLGLGSCSATDVWAGILPAVCTVVKTGLVAGDGYCVFTFAVF